MVAAAIALITLARVAMLFWAPVPLAPDEAQYVGWSRSLSGGYFSKPPLIAWALAGAQAACSVPGGFAGAARDLLAAGALVNEGCVRWWQPLAFALAGVFVWCIGRTLTGRHVAGALAALTLVTMPALGFYSAFATTDAWLMLCWSLALLSVVRALVVAEGTRAERWWWVMCGVACGLGMLTKYSMVLFAAALVVLMIWQGRWRSRGPWIAAAMALVVASPNIVWNALEGFPTIAHHVEISEVSSGLHRGLGQRLQSAGEFAAAQFGVFGPLVLIAALLATLRPARLRAGSVDSLESTGSMPKHALAWRTAVAFGWLPLMAIGLQALLSRAFANWAMPAAVGVALLAALWWMRPVGSPVEPWSARAWRWSVGIGLALNAVVLLGPVLWPHTPWAMERNRNPFLRLEGWREVAHLVARAATSHPAGEDRPIVAARERDLLAALSAYAWPLVPEVRAWNPAGRRSNHYAWFQDLARTEGIGSREVLLVGIVPRSQAQAEGGTDPGSIAEADLEAQFEAEWGTGWRQAFDRVEPVDLPGLDAPWPGGRREKRFIVMRAHRFTGYR